LENLQRVVAAGRNLKAAAATAELTKFRKSHLDIHLDMESTFGMGIGHQA
jgi:hypothetical protein